MLRKWTGSLHDEDYGGPNEDGVLDRGRDGPRPDGPLRVCAENPRGPFESGWETLTSSLENYFVVFYSDNVRLLGARLPTQRLKTKTRPVHVARQGERTGVVPTGQTVLADGGRSRVVPLLGREAVVRATYVHTLYGGG